MNSVKKTWFFAAICCFITACSENVTDDTQSPVLNKDPVIHVIGDDSENKSPADINPPARDPDVTDPVVVPDPPLNPQDPVVEPAEPADDDPKIDPNPVDDPHSDDNPDVTDQDPDDEDKPTQPEYDPNIPDDDPIIKDVDGVPVQPLTYKPFTTLQVTHKPNIGTAYYKPEYVKSLIADHIFKVTEKAQYKTYGLGQITTEGEPWIIRESLLRASAPSLSHKGKSLAYFWQISDPQIIDEESPCRMEGVTIYPYVFASAYRPQGPYSTHMFDLHVQTAKRISDLSSRPFDFALITGDIADNAQKNENAWFHRMMAGGILNPDTGIDDDPIPGPGNDFNDPFYSPGIGSIPWYPAIGNHDILYMGFTPHNQKISDVCTGDEIVDLFDYAIVANHEYRDGYRNGFQDGSSPDAAVVTSGKTPADPERKLLSKQEALQTFYDSPGLPKGHGLDPDIMAKGWGYYSTYPIEGKPIRLISLDTNSGVYSEADMSSEQFIWLKEQLDDANAKNELVILQSHHGTEKLSGFVSQDKFRELVASYPGVVIHITGHGHYNDSSVFRHGDGGYWEVMLASVVDFPSQTRVFEIVHEGNGLIAIYITNLDPNAPLDTFVDTALNYAAARKFFSTDDDPIGDWVKEKDHRNLILRTTVPERIYKNLEKYEWNDIIESEAFLNKLEYKPSK